MVGIQKFEKCDIEKVIAFEQELRKQEPDTYYWEMDEHYRMQLEKSFVDERFNTAVSMLAYKDEYVIGRVDASLISTRVDVSCCSAYLDWICVLKSERHHGIGQLLLKGLIEELNKHNVELLIAMMAGNDEAQSFYHSVENAEMHDVGIWIEIKK